MFLQGKVYFLVCVGIGESKSCVGIEVKDLSEVLRVSFVQDEAVFNFQMWSSEET